MKVEAKNTHSRRPQGDQNDAQFCAAPETRGDVDFAVALQERYQRLSLLTLDLAEEAGGAAQHETPGERMEDFRRKKPGRFERRIAAMTRAIWAHKEIERLRTGRNPDASHYGANANRQRPAGNRTRHDEFPSFREEITCTNFMVHNVSCGTQAPFEFNRMRTIGSRKKEPNSVGIWLTGETQVTDNASTKTSDAGDSEYGLNDEIVYDGPTSVPDFDAAVYDGAVIFDQDGIDEAKLHAAIRQALRDGERGEEALKAALSVKDDAQSTSVRAPP